MVIELEMSLFFIASVSVRKILIQSAQALEPSL